MAKHNETGATGEHMAAAFLRQKGYNILHRNWRFQRTEVDIIAEQAGGLVFVEVKTRRGLGFGFPEEAVTARKQADLRKAANAFIELHPRFPSVRFDIIAILLSGEQAREIIQWEDAFY